MQHGAETVNEEARRTTYRKRERRTTYRKREKEAQNAPMSS
jgi:hypothetical protein